MNPTPPAPAPAGAPRSSKGLEWLRTREGKIVAGAAAVVAVVLMALRRKAGGAGGGFVAEPQQGAPDGTIQDRLDQLTGAGGSIDELRATLSGIAGSLDRLTDLQDAQDPAAKPTTPTNKALTAVGGLKASSNKQDITWLWNPVSGAAKYVVELIQGKDTVVKRQTVTGTRWRVGGGLQADKPYRVRITPVGATGASGPAASHVFRTQPR